jgi:hypothetical protein
MKLFQLQKVSIQTAQQKHKGNASNHAPREREREIKAQELF